MQIVQAPSISDLFLFWMIRHAREKEVRHSNPKFPKEGWNRIYKGNKNFGTKPSYSPALPLLCVFKKEQTRRFQGESFFISWKLGYLQGDAKPTCPLLPPFLGDAAWNWIEPEPSGQHQGWHRLVPFCCCRTPLKHSQEPPGTRGAHLCFPVTPFPPTQHIFPPSPATQLSVHLANTFPLSNFNRHWFFSAFASPKKVTRISLAIIFWVTQLVLKYRAVNMVYF